MDTKPFIALMLLFGMQSPEQAYGKTDADFYGAEHAREALEDERRVMETGQPLLGKVDCPCCGRRRFEWLEGTQGSQTTSLCGRNAVQVSQRSAEISPREQPLRRSLNNASKQLTSMRFVRFR